MPNCQCVAKCAIINENIQVSQEYIFTKTEVWGGGIICDGFVDGEVGGRYKGESDRGKRVRVMEEK